LGEAVGGAAGNFYRAWAAARGLNVYTLTSEPRQVALGLAAAQGTVAELSRLMVGEDPQRIMIYEGSWPDAELFRYARPRRGASRAALPCSLLEIAAGSAAAASVRFLLEFCGVPANEASLHSAIAKGDPEVVRTLWDRMLPEAREGMVVGLAKTAAEFHEGVLLAWLLRGGRVSDVEEVGVWALDQRQADAVLTLLEIGWDAAAGHAQVVEALAKWKDMRLLDVIAPRSWLGWTIAMVRSDSATQAFLLENPPKDAPEELVEFTRLVARGDKSKDVVEYLRGVRVVGGVAPREFKVLLSEVHVAPVDRGDDGLLAWLAVDREYAKTSASVSDAHIAVVAGDSHALRELVAAGAELDECDGRERKRPVEWALERGRGDLAAILLEGGAREVTGSACACCHECCEESCLCCQRPCCTVGRDHCYCCCDLACCAYHCQVGRNPWARRSWLRRAGMTVTTLIGLAAVCMSFMFCGSARARARRAGASDLSSFIH
jgi:hypothetical protein